MSIDRLIRSTAGLPSSFGDPSTVPDSPTNLIATVISAIEIDLSWVAPVNVGTGVLLGYIIQQSLDNGSSWTTITTNTNSLATTYNDVDNSHSTTYTYRVFAISTIGTGPPSNTAIATTLNDIPHAPTGLTASIISSTEIDLSWTAPADIGGSAITGYKIERETPLGNGFSTIVASTGNANTTYANTGLTGGIQYNYRVSAINALGTSPVSNQANATTITPPVPPNAPTALTANAISTSQINLSWTAPVITGGAPITGYKIERSPNNTTWTTIVTDTGNTLTSYTDNGLAASTLYYYRVSAINSAGTGSASTVANATTQATPVPPATGNIDQFGVLMLYPTITSGNTWFFKQNDVNPTISGSDPRFDPQGTTITRNADGSWKKTGTAVRMNVYAITKANWSAKDTSSFNYGRNILRDRGYMDTAADFGNFELTGYFKINTWTSTDDSITFYGRGGLHHTSGPDTPTGCEGSAYKLDIYYLGGTTARFAKESWHVHYDFQSSNKGTTPNILNKWVGIKMIVANKVGVNFPTKVIMRGWIDANADGNWAKAVSFEDDGFGSGATHCPTAAADNMPITWKGPSVTFRWDTASNVDFKWLSCREIDPLTVT